MPARLKAHRIGCGIDVVDIERFQTAVKRGGVAFLNRIFTASEQAYAAKHRDRILRLAARFAAKEAVIKAMSQLDPKRLLMPKQVEVHNDALGRPSVKLLRAAASPRVTLQISLTHTQRTAAACVVAFRA